MAVLRFLAAFFDAGGGKAFLTFMPTEEVSAALTIYQMERQVVAEQAAWLKLQPDLPQLPFA